MDFFFGSGYICCFMCSSCRGYCVFWIDCVLCGKKVYWFLILDVDIGFCFYWCIFVFVCRYVGEKCIGIVRNFGWICYFCVRCVLFYLFIDESELEEGVEYEFIINRLVWNWLW